AGGALDGAVDAPRGGDHVLVADGECGRPGWAVGIVAAVGIVRLGSERAGGAVATTGPVAVAHSSAQMVRWVKVTSSRMSSRGSTPRPGPSGTIIVPPFDSNGVVMSRVK